MYMRSLRAGASVAGRVFLAYPDHIAPYWRTAKGGVWSEALLMLDFARLQLRI